MYLGKKLITLLLSLLFVFSIISITQAKSVYVISDTEDSNLAAYSIDGDQITRQAKVDIDTYGYGAVGNAVWPDKDLMFVTYERSPMVVWEVAAAMIFCSRCLKFCISALTTSSPCSST